MIKVENLHAPHVAEQHILEVHILWKDSNLPEMGWLAADPYIEPDGSAVWPFVHHENNGEGADAIHTLAVARIDADGWSYAVLPLAPGI